LVESFPIIAQTLPAFSAGLMVPLITDANLTEKEKNAITGINNRERVANLRFIIIQFWVKNIDPQFSTTMPCCYFPVFLINS
jgi:hypothetical protein